ncbi:MAG: tripartite tricarboxylate transporter TctB family protein [Burkholderiaceae bacterium]
MSSTRQPRPAEWVFALLAFAIGLFLASRIGSELSWQARQPLHRQPGFWPSLAIVGMLVFGLGDLILRWRANPRQGSDSVIGEFALWARGLEFVAWFVLYVQAVRWAGYLPSTLVFCTGLAWRLGYRSRRWMVLAGLFGFSTVLIFKSVLAVKIPGGVLYEALPTDLRNLMIRFF